MQQPSTPDQPVDDCRLCRVIDVALRMATDSWIVGRTDLSERFLSTAAQLWHDHGHDPAAVLNDAAEITRDRATASSPKT
jgi:hypothetical protein